MSATIDHKSYLQKYLSGASAEKKKKKKKNVKGKGFKIIDDDLDLSKMRALDGDELDILNEGEDAPQIAGIIDERPEELKKLDAFQNSSKWRVINQDDGFNSKLKVEEVKRSRKEVEKENEIVFGKMYSDSEDEKKNDSDASPPRRNDNKTGSNIKVNEKHNSDSSFSPPRRDKSKISKNYDSDASPPRKIAKNDKKDHHVNHIDSDTSPPRRKNDAESSKPKYDTDKKSKNIQIDKKRTRNQSDSDVSPPRHKKDIQTKNRVRKSSRWGDFKDESNLRSGSPGDRLEQCKNSPDRSKNINSSSSKNYNNDLDASPPRKSRCASPKRNRSPDSDESPPRTHKERDNKNYNNYRDNSSLKRSKYQKYSEQTKRSHESHKRRNKSDSDESPPRKENNKGYNKRIPSKNNRQDSDSDLSPPRNKRRDSDLDLSPTRKERSKAYNKRIPNRSNRQDSDSDLSAPRKERNKRKDSDSDLSPPRQERNKTNDKRSGNRSKRHDNDSDLSPRRKGKNYQERRDDSSSSNKRMEKTLEGKQAGLQDARQLKQENEAFRKREDEAFRNMTDEMSGRNAKIVSRKGNRDTSEDRQKQKEKAERQKVLDDKYKQWSRGLKQLESQQAAVQDFIHEASKPLARYKDDRDLESRLKDVEREGDPMLKYMRDKKRERGEMGPEKPAYKGSFPPNRFNIRPGYRWDGVDRSNGYENKYFAQQSKKKAQEEEVYKWSTEDL